VILHTKHDNGVAARGDLRVAAVHPRGVAPERRTQRLRGEGEAAAQQVVAALRLDRRADLLRGLRELGVHAQPAAAQNPHQIACF
jgi:hypothetical protein